MTVAELLVQTEATLFSAFENRALVSAQAELIAHGRFSTTQLERSRGSARVCASKDARRIVAAIYGEPCDRMIRTAGEVMANNHPANQCANCLWPRSSHGAKP